MDRGLKIIDLYDEISRDTDIAVEVIPNLFQVFIQFLQNEENVRADWLKALSETRRLTQKLNDANNEISGLEKQVKTARRLLDEEKLKRKRVEEERNYVENQLEMVRNVIEGQSNKINDETKEKLTFLNSRQSLDPLGDRLDTITELETTGSVMSDLSYTRDEDDLLSTSGTETRSYKRSSSNQHEFSKSKKRRTSTTKMLDGNERLVATTTVTVAHSGPVSAKSIIETVSSEIPSHSRGETLYRPSAPPLSDSSDTENDASKTPARNKLHSGVPFSMNLINTRPHNFQQKALMKPEMCNVCCKRLRFSTMAAKCKECKAVCHISCKDSVPLPCVPINTPTSKGSVGTIADYTPQVGPMVPSLVVHCIKEIEARGLTEVGLYRVPGSDKEVKTLKEKFLRGKGAPNLSQIPDIHTICGCLKDFLRSLKEPLITHIRCEEFLKASDIRDLDDRRARLYQIISELPQPNRDTLAYIVLHLQKVAESPDCKMPILNLSKMFGPSVVGYTKGDLEHALVETNQANKIMAELLSMPTEYWENLIKGAEIKGSENDMQKTPSTNSLMSFFLQTEV